MAERQNQPPDPQTISWQTAEYSGAQFPEFTGDDIIAAAFRLTDTYPGDFSPETRQETALHIIDMADRVRPGEPALRLQWDSRERRNWVVSAATVVEPLELTQRMYHAGWGLRFPVESKRGDHPYRQIWHVPVEDMLYASRAHHEPPLIVGEFEVRDWLYKNALTTFWSSDKPHLETTRKDLEQLEELVYADFPPSFLGLTPQRYERVVKVLGDSVLQDGFHVVGRKAQLLQYLLRLEETPEDSADERLLRIAARNVPLTGIDEPATKRLLRFAEDLGAALRIGEGSPHDRVGYEFYVRRQQAYVLSRLYKHRAEQMPSEQASPATNRPQPAVGVEAPPLRPLAMATGPLETAKLRNDSDYVTQLRLAGVPAGTFKLQFAELRHVGDNMSRLLIETGALKDCLDVLANLEYLFEANDQADESQRQAFYDELQNKLAKWLPMHFMSERPLNLHLAAAEALSIMYPPAARAQDGRFLHGQAAVAAVLGGFYERKLEQVKLRERYFVEGDVPTYLPVGSVRLDILDLGEPTWHAAAERYEQTRQAGQRAQALIGAMAIMQHAQPEV